MVRRNEMKTERKFIKIRELCEGYINNTDTNEERGVYAYGGKLCVRPEYQRSFVYDKKKANAVINTALCNLPLSIMYWVDNEDGTYDCLDGQQRTISLCDFVAGDTTQTSFKAEWLRGGKETYFDTLQAYDPELVEEFLDYEIEVYLCKGTKRDRLDWFNTINIAGEALSEQEIRNANHTSKWLTDAKRYFSRASKTGTCPAEALFKKYIGKDANRQLLLEQVIYWRVGDKSDAAICAYMEEHMKDEDASDLWNYFNEVVAWVKNNFEYYDNGFKTVEWGWLYNQYKDTPLNPEEIADLMKELFDAKTLKELTCTKAAIVEYCITGNEQLLTHREFSDAQRKLLYNRQNGICPDCGQPFAMSDMHAHHIKSWRQGGITEPSNGVMLCTECHHNRHGY